MKYVSNKRAKACQIKKATKNKVYSRDDEICVFCAELFKREIRKPTGFPGFPEAHVVSRAKGGLGVEANIITSCRIDHDIFDNPPDEETKLLYTEIAENHMEKHYPGWSREQVRFNKWEEALIQP